MPVPRIWLETPGLIRDFLTRRVDYEQLASEVAYILKTRVGKAGIRYASITYRTKTLESFLEKLERKKYEEPITQVTDLAGARIVCLYPGDLPKIESIIREEFDVIEKIDKIAEHEADRFGYDAVHFLVKLGPKSCGARYDDLKGLICEIQTRTVLQDAWAIIDHHLFYKREGSVPSTIRRKLHSLAGMFETVDEHFEIIRAERDQYIHTLEAMKTEPGFLAQECNLDSFKALCQRFFPNRKREADTEYSRVFSWLIAEGYHTLRDLERAVEKARSALADVMDEVYRGDEEVWTDLFCLHVSVGLVNESYGQSAAYGSQVRAALQKLAVG